MAGDEPGTATGEPAGVTNEPPEAIADQEDRDPDARDPGGPRAATTLPPRVRRALVEFSAEALAGLGEADVPAGLRKIRTFAPMRRAKAGSALIAMALDREAGFRLPVARRWRQLNPELAAQIDAGEVAPAVDPVLAATGTYLCRPEGWEQQLAGWLEAIAADGRTSAVTADETAGAAVRAALTRAREEAAEARSALAALEEETSTLRRDQRRLRADADRARAATREAERRAAQEQERLTAVLAERDEQLQQAGRQVQEATEQLAGARRSARDGRSLAEVRARLLLDTIVESAAGLRRELALPPAAQTPAELVAAQLTPAAVPVTVPARGRAGDDPELLAEFLRLPKAHLVVDGYNVSMEGYGALPLVDQRRLLVDALAALAARTSAEVTCCFDGAEVDGRSQGLIRGIRVLFSDPGTTADDLIGRLVRAEPPGRVLVVVSSDREVAAAAVAAGARPFPSTVLLRLVGAGLRDRGR